MKIFIGQGCVLKFQAEKEMLTSSTTLYILETFNWWALNRNYEN